jgi:hypothetical protein
MAIYPGDVRVFHLSRRSEVFVPASEAEAARFDAAYVRDLPRRITSMIEILDEAFPRAAEAYRRAEIAAPVARIGIALEDYEDEPDAIVDEICRQTRTAALSRFLLCRQSAAIYCCACCNEAPGTHERT